MSTENCDCGRSLTREEISDYGSICMQCYMAKQRIKCATLGMDLDALDDAPEFFGRTEEEKEKFSSNLEENAEFKAMLSNKKSKNHNTSPDTTSSGNPSFEVSANKQIGHEIFQNKKPIVISARGANEDIKLTLEMPRTYPIRKEYFEQTEKLLNQYLEIVVHFLAFAPLTNANLEEYLIEKFNLKDKM